MKHIRIESVDQTDVLIRADSIKCVLQTKKGCKVYLDGGIVINTGAPYDLLAAVLTKEE